MPLRFTPLLAHTSGCLDPDYATQASSDGPSSRVVSVARVAANLDIHCATCDKPTPGGIFPEDKFAIVPHRRCSTVLSETLGNTFYALPGAVVLLLLIACRKVSDLLLGSVAHPPEGNRAYARYARLQAAEHYQTMLVERFIVLAPWAGTGAVYALANTSA